MRALEIDYYRIFTVSPAQNAGDEKKRALHFLIFSSYKGIG